MKEKIDRITAKTVDATLKITDRIIKWILIIILVYIVISMLYLSYNQRGEFLVNIVIWSVGGFWAFFMGYWGWMFAEKITQSFVKKTKK